MLLSDPATTPAWAALHSLSDAPSLDREMATGVCVVGAGVAGLTTALLLTLEGVKVVVLDAGQPGGGESARTTAHLANAIDDRYFNIARWHGREGAILAARSHGAAIDRIERFVEELGLSCDYRRLDGYLFPAREDEDDNLDEELKAAHAAGLLDTELCAWPGATGPRCLCFRRQAQISPWPYLRGLADEIIRRGGRIYGGTRVAGIDEGPEVVIHTENGHQVRAEAVVVSTNSPINDRFALHTKMAPYRTYVVALPVAAGAVPPGLYWDTADPYHYARLAPTADPSNELLIVGGEDHKTGQDEDGAEARFARLVAWARERFPAVGAGAPLHCWSGQVLETIDGLGFLGRDPGTHDNTYVATGDSGMGMTHGTIAGMIITDLIRGRSNPWSKLYDPGRVTLSAAITFAQENINVARQYLNWARPHAREDAAALAPGAGCVVQRGLHKVALHRDAAGALHERSAVCPHLGCIVAWNAVEHSWDCPCHGSRFAATGEVVSGPATSALESAAD